MKIGIDIDDTLNSLAPVLLKEGKLYNKKHKIEYEIKENEWLFEDSFGWNNDDINDFIENHLRKLFTKANPQPNAVEVIKKLRNAGHEIVIITARGSSSDWNPYRICKNWLDRYNIVYDKLIVKCSNKGKICEEEGIDVFIDDNPDYCSTVKSNSIKVFLFDSKYNQNDKTFDRVYNWDEIYKKILNIKNR